MYLRCLPRVVGAARESWVGVTVSVGSRVAGSDVATWGLSSKGEGERSELTAGGLGDLEASFSEPSVSVSVVLP